MKGFLYIDNDVIGEVNFKIIDESMGGIGVTDSEGFDGIYVEVTGLDLTSLGKIQK